MVEIKAALAQNARDVDVTLEQLLAGAARPGIQADGCGSLRDAVGRQANSAFSGNVERGAVRRLQAVRAAWRPRSRWCCYSLIHDDLPAMDNDDLRRGLPTCHVKFDEATAILAGDALLARAFEVIAEPATHPDPRVRSDLVGELAKAAGAEGMVGGQMLDLLAEQMPLEIAEITRLQRMKTGALIAPRSRRGARQASDSARHALRAYAHDLGLAFQIVDDLLDVEGNDEEVGKRTRKDQGAGKATFVSVLGVERARAQSDMLAQQAVQHLEMFSDSAAPLRALASFVVNRRH